MNEISALAIIELATDLTAGLASKERYDRLLDTVRKTIPCEAVALLSFDGSELKPIAMQGLSRDTLGRRFLLREHPRFAAICQSRHAVRFAADSPLPDPYDGLLIDRDDDLPMHACMGLPLYFDEQLLGVLSLDSLTPGVFDDIPRTTLEIVSNIAAATLNTALIIEQLENRAQHSLQVVHELNNQVLERDGGELIGQSSAMEKLRREISIAAPSDFTVLIQGDTGVGKELVARMIHRQSPLNQGPLVYVNCAALPENLIESELFGHVKGAFTGADHKRSGKFALADGGSLFLDEIGELPLPAQSKLLRALQNKEIQPVGQDLVQQVNVRVIAATNRDLPLEVEQGRFRADLYHRLSVYPINVPKLSERIGDTELLAGFFIEHIRRKLGISQLKLADDAMKILNSYHWPGNVRELEHVISRCALKASAQTKDNRMVVIKAEHCNEIALAAPIANQGITPVTDEVLSAQPHTIALTISPLNQATQDFQKRLIVQAIEHNNGNWAGAARDLSVDRGNLSRLCKRLGIRAIKRLEQD